MLTYDKLDYYKSEMYRSQQMVDYVLLQSVSSLSHIFEIDYSELVDLVRTIPQYIDCGDISNIANYRTTKHIYIHDRVEYIPGNDEYLKSLSRNFNNQDYWVDGLAFEVLLLLIGYDSELLVRELSRFAGVYDDNIYTNIFNLFIARSNTKYQASCKLHFDKSCRMLLNTLLHHGMSFDNCMAIFHRITKGIFNIHSDKIIQDCNLTGVNIYNHADTDTLNLYSYICGVLNNTISNRNITNYSVIRKEVIEMCRHITIELPHNIHFNKDIDNDLAVSFVSQYPIDTRLRLFA